MILYNLEKVLIDLKLTYESFVDFCIMLGCDYSCKIPGFGPVTGYKLITEYNSFTELSEKSKIKVPGDFKYTDSLNKFIESPEILIKNKKDLNLKKENINLENFKELNLNPKILNRIVKLINNYKYQFNILDFIHKV